MKKYEGQSDELLLQMRQGETDVAEYLVKKYKYLVLRKARAMYLVGGDTDDLIQEGMLGLFKAVQSYRRKRRHPLPRSPGCVFSGSCTVRWRER